MATDLGPTIQTAAGGPRKVKTDRLEVEAQPIGDQIAADRYLAAKASAGNRLRGLRITKLIGPPQCPATPTGGLNNQFGDDGSYS